MGDGLPPHAMIVRRILKLSRSGTKGLSGEFGQLLLRLGQNPQPRGNVVRPHCTVVVVPKETGNIPQGSGSSLA